MIAITNEIEIRGKEIKTSKTGNQYIIVRAEDETGKLSELCDRNIDRFDTYKKGLNCKLVLDITMDRYTNIQIVDVIL